MGLIGDDFHCQPLQLFDVPLDLSPVGCRGMRAIDDLIPQLASLPEGPAHFPARIERHREVGSSRSSSGQDDRNGGGTVNGQLLDGRISFRNERGEAEKSRSAAGSRYSRAGPTDGRLFCGGQCTFPSVGG
jgi:hypothetical protein